MAESKISNPGSLNYTVAGQLLNVYFNCYLNKKSISVLGVVI